MEYFDRVRQEREDLARKVISLESFIMEDGGIYDGLGKYEKIRLANQLSVMKLYLKILDERIEAYLS
ncbi:hypothetical protein O1C08_001345 [Vibrio cholerae]|nr:hypothetical protein [Vibrio cholerae]